MQPGSRDLRVLGLTHNLWRPINFWYKPKPSWKGQIAARPPYLGRYRRTCSSLHDDEQRLAAKQWHRDRATLQPHYASAAKGSGRQRKSGSEHASRESGKRAVGKGIASASSRPCRWRRARQASRDFVSSDAADNSVAAANWSSALRRAAQELSSYAGLDKVDKTLHF